MEYGSLGHRMLLKHVNLWMRGTIRSVDAFRRLSLVYDHFPDFFVAEYAATQLDQELLADVLTSAGLQDRGNHNPRYWIENSRRLVDRWGGDPLNIFEGVETYDQACLRIRNDGRGNGFFGYQKKMVSMIIYYFMEARFIDPFRFPPPIDLHIGRVALSLGLVKVFDHNGSVDVRSPEGEKLLDVIRELFMWYVATYDVDPVELANATWLYSVAMCSGNPEYVWERVGEHDNRATQLRKRPANYRDDTTMSQWLASCGSCNFASKCKLNSGPSMPYYTWGKFILDDPRLGPPTDPDDIGRLLSANAMAKVYRRAPSGSSGMAEASRAADGATEVHVQEAFPLEAKNPD
jgi:hypothetical protein